MSSSCMGRPGSQSNKPFSEPWHNNASENHARVICHATLGVIAGGGPFPGRVAAAAQATGRPVFIVALRGFADPDVVGPFPHAVARMGAAGEILSLLRRH